MTPAEEASELDTVAYLVSLGADTVPHLSGRSLLMHLKGMAELVAAWGLPREVVLAALCHSVYGTEYFPRETLSPNERETLRQRIGTVAERLVFLFHSLRRASLFTGEGAGGLRWINANDPNATSHEFQCLAHLGVANLIEPYRTKDLLSRCRLMRTRRNWESVVRYLAPEANVHIASIYKENHVPLPIVAGVTFLQRCVSRVRPRRMAAMARGPLQGKGGRSEAGG